MFHKSCNKRVSALIAPGLEECEALVVYDLLFRAGIECDLIAVTDELEVESSHGVKIVCNKLVADTDFDEYDLIFLPGGIPGTPNLEQNDYVQAALKDFIAKDKEVAAICAAPSILANAGYLQGKKATSNPSFQHVLEEKGALLQKDEYVVRDGHLTTSQGMGTAMLFGFTLIEVLAGSEAVENVKAGIVYPY